MSNEELDAMDDLIERAKKRGYDTKANEELVNESEFWPYQLLFDHEFAKSLFGEEPVRWPAYSPFEKSPSNDLTIMSSYSIVEGPAYKYHLQQAAIADSPIEYARKNS